MSSSTTRLAIELALLVLGAVLMCIGVRWIFFVGFVLLVLSSFLSVQPRSPHRWPLRLLWWFTWVAALFVLLWLSSFGREPLPWVAACIAVFSVGMSEIECWRASRVARGTV